MTAALLFFIFVLFFFFTWQERDATVTQRTRIWIEVYTTEVCPDPKNVTGQWLKAGTALKVPRAQECPTTA